MGLSAVWRVCLSILPTLHCDGVSVTLFIKEVINLLMRILGTKLVPTQSSAREVQNSSVLKESCFHRRANNISMSVNLKRKWSLQAYNLINLRGELIKDLTLLTAIAVIVHCIAFAFLHGAQMSRSSNSPSQFPFFVVVCVGKTEILVVNSTDRFFYRLRPTQLMDR